MCRVMKFEAGAGTPLVVAAQAVPKSRCRDGVKGALDDQSARLPRQSPIERFDLSEAHIEIG